MAEADFEIVGVMGGSDFDRAGPEGHFDRIIGDDGNGFPADRNVNGLADEGSIPWVVRMNGNRNVTKHGFRPGRRDHDRTRIAGIADLPEVRRLFFVSDLDVGEGGFAAGAPVGDGVAAVEGSFIVQVNEGFENSLLAGGIEGEPFPTPVDRCAKAADLAGNSVSVFFFPFPNRIHKCVSAEVEPGLTVGV